MNEDSGVVGERPNEEQPLPDAAGLVSCPYCGETVELLLDAGSGDVQEYVEDCEVCCQPWQIRVRYTPDGQASIEVDVLD